ncbi:hypothetical protein crov040 [Cafeteria roenbergensis virus]|uniref:Uncharacterized protein n=1 Tax=Cafeteria roenbergensis virus (strain BV-PW1) TaxID=693272 RepID=E3T4G0_CROVB|nr:hypothetical protein crov040 [Cafeteria roenbergensis virus BV-PW1]ADO67073.1 hypothetical protein crov040 [Cafeteria roenbergensis virus BV-PW1]
MDLSNYATIIFTLATIAVVSLDLGKEYNKNEVIIYQHPIFQILVVLSGIYLNVSNLQQGSIVFIIWILIKFFKFKSNV